MTGCGCGDARYHCQYGLHHVVPSLAADCDGREHGYPPQPSTEDTDREV